MDKKQKVLAVKNINKTKNSKNTLFSHYLY